MADDTICTRFLKVASRETDRPAIVFPRKNKWIEQSWQNYRQVVEEIAGALQNLGVVKGDRVAIFSNTRAEWAYCDMAILCIGGVTVPIYQSSTADDLAHIMQHSESKIIFCESVALFRRVKEVQAKLPALKTIICIDSEKLSEDQVMSFEKVLDTGAKWMKANPNFFEKTAKSVSLEDLASVVYTSGTTGLPKGVAMTHTQVMSEVTDAFPLLGINVKDRTLTFLPFAHVFGRVEIWGHVIIGYTMYYAEGIDRLRENMISTKPTVMVAVPRIFEKIYASLMSMAEVSPIKRKVFEWAIGVGRQASACKLARKTMPLDVALQYQLAKKLVFNQIHEAMGGQLRFVFSGGAPLNPAIAEFFHAVGLVILEGYGLTETTAGVTVNTPFDYRFGTVGKPIGDVRLKIASDGEVLVQSKKVMKEYYNDPAATAEVFQDGWFMTGDIGEISSDGFLKITDRKKDLIKTAGGKYVAPQKLEALLQLSRYISHAHIYGDQRKYIVSLITLNPEPVKKFAEDKNISYKDFSSLVKNSAVRELIHSAVSEANSHLAGFESIKNFEIIPNDFKLETGELTPSLKVKRKVVDKNYAEILEKLYK